MPYNTSRGTVIRKRAILERLLFAQQNVTFPAHNPEKLARQIREALFAAQKHKEFKKYHELRHLYRVKAKSGWVECEFLGLTLPEVVAYAPERMNIPEAEEVNAVVGACIKFEEKADELHFPNVIVTPREAEVLYKWGRTQDPFWQIIVQDEAGVTMTRRDVEEEFLWHPEIPQSDTPDE